MTPVSKTIYKQIQSTWTDFLGMNTPPGLALGYKSDTSLKYAVSIYSQRNQFGAAIIRDGWAAQARARLRFNK